MDTQEDMSDPRAKSKDRVKVVTYRPQRRVSNETKPVLRSDKQGYLSHPRPQKMKEISLLKSSFNIILDCNNIVEKFILIQCHLKISLLSEQT